VRWRSQAATRRSGRGRSRWPRPSSICEPLSLLAVVLPRLILDFSSFLSRADPLCNSPKVANPAAMIPVFMPTRMGDLPHGHRGGH
jgi:hypothetical protein